MNLIHVVFLKNCFRPEVVQNRTTAAAMQNLMRMRQFPFTVYVFEAAKMAASANRICYKDHDRM